MTRLILLGPPGAGKGTQAARITAERGVPHVSTGDIFRDNIARETELGLQVKEITASGAYVPDEVTNAIVADRLALPDAAAGFVLDGYPRTPGQVEALDLVLAEQGAVVDVVLELTADVEEVVARLLHRSVQQDRADDTEDVIRRRLAVYAEETAPLTAVYEQRGLLRRVDGLGEVEDVAARVREVLDAVATAPRA